MIGGKNTMPNKRKVLSVVIDDRMEQLLKERMEYLQEKRPDANITISDAVRHAITQTSYKKKGKKTTEEDD